MVFRRQTTKETRRPRGQGRPRPHRVRTQEVADKLRTWVQQQEGLLKPPSLKRALEGKCVLSSVK